MQINYQNVILETNCLEFQRVRYYEQRINLELLRGSLTYCTTCFYNVLAEIYAL